MNIFDIIIIVVVAFCLIRGFFRGLVGEISGIIGVFAGFYGAYTYYPLLTIYAEPWINSETLRNVAAFFLLFCAILIVISLIALAIKKLLKLVFLGWVDRTFGLVFGGAKGILVMSVVFIILTTFLPKNANFLKQSVLAPYLSQVSSALTVFISQKDKGNYMKNLEGLY